MRRCSLLYKPMLLAAVAALILLRFLLPSFPLSYNGIVESSPKRSFTPTLPNNNNSFFGNDGMVVDNGYLPSSTNLTIKDITFTIKTSHTLAARWDLILFTWYQQAKESVVWITDKKSMLLKLKSDQVLEADCLTDHSMMALSCKTEAAYEEYMRRKTKWWCHMDDDMYVNTDVLIRLLSKYDPDSDVYIGRNSVTYPWKYIWENSYVSAWFGTGGGYCISRGLAPKMEKYMSGGKLRNLCWRLSAADDCTVGFIINFFLRTKLTVTNLISTHLNLHRLNYLKPQQLPHQAMLSYGGDVRVNITARDVQSKSKFFNTDDDPSRFFTIHCMVHPQTDYCQPV